MSSCSSQICGAELGSEAEWEKVISGRVIVVGVSSVIVEGQTDVFVAAIKTPGWCVASTVPGLGCLRAAAFSRGGMSSQKSLCMLVQLTKVGKGMRSYKMNIGGQTKG